MLSLTESIDAQGLQLGQRKRRFFVPTFDLRFEYDYMLDRQPDFGEISRDFYLLQVAAR